MIRTHVFEAVAKAGKVEEIDLGWCMMPEVPVEKRPPATPAPGEPLPQPMVIKIGGEAFFIIGHTWELSLDTQPVLDNETTLILIVQRVPAMPSGLVRADASTLGQLERVMPPPGGNGSSH